MSKTDMTDIWLPRWMPAWFWRASRTAWFGSGALGVATYFIMSLINDVTGTIPLWVCLMTGVLAVLTVRLGLFLDWRRIDARR